MPSVDEALVSLLKANTQGNRYEITKAIDDLLVARLTEAGIEVKPRDGVNPIDAIRTESDARREAMIERNRLAYEQERLLKEESVDVSNPSRA